MLVAQACNDEAEGVQPHNDEDTFVAFAKAYKILYVSGTYNQ